VEGSSEKAARAKTKSLSHTVLSIPPKLDPFSEQHGDENCNGGLMGTNGSSQGLCSSADCALGLQMGGWAAATVLTLRLCMLLTSGRGPRAQQALRRNGFFAASRASRRSRKMQQAY